MVITQANKSRAKKNAPLHPDWPAVIKARRLQLGETQEQFGRRFGVNSAAVSHWEKGRRDAPGKVTWWLTHG